MSGRVCTTPILLCVLLLLIWPPGGASLSLSNWQGELAGALGPRTVLDLFLPGTHDTLTYDLDTIVSYGADDDSAAISAILHVASELGVVPGQWIRDQARVCYK
jgi:hypothetical protein